MRVLQGEIGGMKKHGLIVSTVLAALVAGCAPGSFLPGQQEPPRLFELTPKSTFEENLPEANWQLLIENPVAAAGIDTTRIALKRSPTTLDYFARAEWSDRAPALVQTLMIESFENTEKIVSVGRESLALRADYSLKVELREFQAEYFDTSAEIPKVHVRLNLKLVRMPDRIIVASKSFGYELQSTSNTLDDIIEAFNESLGKSLKRAVSWTMKTADADWRSQRSPAVPPRLSS